MTSRKNAVGSVEIIGGVYLYIKEKEMIFMVTTHINIENGTGNQSDFAAANDTGNENAILATESDGVDTSKDTGAEHEDFNLNKVHKRGYLLNVDEVCNFINVCDGDAGDIVDGYVVCIWKDFRAACQRLGISYIDAFSEINESRLFNEVFYNTCRPFDYFYNGEEMRRDLKAILTGEDDTASVIYYLYCCYELDLKPGKVFVDAFGNVTDGEVDEVRNRGYVKDANEITYGKMYDIADCKIGCRLKDFRTAQKRFGRSFQYFGLSNGFDEGLKERLQPIWEKYRGLNSYETNSLLINAVKGKNDITVAEYIVLCAMERLDPNHLSVDASGNVIYTLF